MFDFNKEKAAYVSVDEFVQNKSKKQKHRKEFRGIVELGKAQLLQANPEQPEVDEKPKQQFEREVTSEQISRLPTECSVQSQVRDELSSFGLISEE